MIEPSKESWDCLVLVGDCLAWLPQLAPGSVHLTVTDPPYESLERHRAVGTTTRLKESKASSNPWFACFPNTGYFRLFRELHQAHATNSHCYVFCDSETEHVILSGRNPYDKRLDESLVAFTLEAKTSREPKGPWTAWPTLSWLKTKRGIETQDGDEAEYDMLSPGMGYHWRRTGERILFLEKGKRKLNNLGWPDALLGQKAGRADFPTTKPDKVLTRLIANSSEEHEVVLDPFAGSGSTGRIACQIGRRAILIEKHPTDWLKRAVEHLGQVEWREL
jgi:site-specific DNA-methyltransferase (adenine-specific)